MRINIALAFLAVTGFIGFGTVAPAYGQGCEIVTPDPFNVNTNGTSGGSGDCGALGLAHDCELNFSSADATKTCPVTIDNVLYTVECTKLAGVVDCHFPADLNPEDVLEAIGGFDGTVVENVSGGQNAQLTFRFDAPEIDYLACTNQQGKASGSTVHMCLDGIAENNESPDPVANVRCTALGGETVEVGGVLVACPADLQSKQIKTVIVASELKDDGTNDPFHGFLNEGQVSNDNQCHCLGPDLTQAEIDAILTPCDPSKEVVNGAAIDALEECPPGEVERGRVSIEFGGSHRTCVGGSCGYW